MNLSHDGFDTTVGIDITGVSAYQTIVVLNTVTVSNADLLDLLLDGNIDVGTVTDINAPTNQAPTDIDLTNATVAEDLAVGSTIGVLSATDPDAGDTASFSIVADADAKFTIVGNELRLDGALDFETETSHSVTVRVTDGGGLFYDEVFVIAVTGVNEVPTDIGLTNATVAEDLAVGSTIGVLSAIDPDAGNTASFSIVADADAKFTIVGNELRLDGALDFETETSHSVTVRVTDGGGLFYDEVFVIAVTGVNEVPTDIGLTNATVAEDLAVGSTIGVLSAIDPDAGDTASFSIVADADAKFTIVGNELRLDGALDFETETSHSVTVRVTDGGGLFHDEVFVITVTDVNEAPAVSLASTTTALDEDTDTTLALKVADIVVTDDALGTNDLTLSGADAALFEIVGGTELFLKAGAALDFETNPDLDVTVEVDDAGVVGAPDDTALLSIAVGDVNEAPAVSLTNTTTALDEDTDTSLAIKVADIVVTDDALGSNVLTLSGADAALFEIVGGTELFLKANAALDFETNPDLDVTVEVDDAGVVGSPDDTAPLSIAIGDVNEAPSVALANTVTALDEDTDTTLALKVADIVVTDDALGSNNLTLSGADAALFEIVGGTELFLRANAALDFETNPDLDVTVEVDDAGVVGSPDDTADLSIAIGDVNEAPAVSLTNTTTALDKETDTSSAIKVADIVVTDDALGSNNLTLSGADAALFEIVGGTELFLKAGAALDFETNPDLDVTVEVDDAGVVGAPDDTAPLSIAIGDVNEAPSVALANTVTALDEDTDTTLALKVADIVIDDDALGSNNLTLSGADAALFEIVGGTELFLIAGAALDFETNPNLDVTVEVDDAGVVGSPDDTAPLLIAIGDVNEAPAVSLTNTTTAIAEDTDTTLAIKVADIVIDDDALGSNDLTLTGENAALFEIVGTELFLIAGAALDFETNPNLDVTVAVDDAGVVGSPDDTAPLSITIGDVNEAPAVSLTNTVTALDEDTDTTLALKVADIVVTDDALGSNVLTLTGADAALFEIVGGTELFLKANAALDFETNPDLDVTVEVDDAGVVGSPDDTAPLSIAIGDVNEAPSVALANTVTALDEDTDTTLALKVADIVVTDDALGTNDLTLTGADAALFEIVGGTELFLIAGAALDFETNPDLDVTVEVDDAGVVGSPDDTAPLSIAIGDANEAPSVSLTNATTAFDENTDTTLALKVADIVVTDDALGTNDLTLSGADAALFEIVGGTELFLKAGAALDFETNPDLDVTVEVDDAGVVGSPDDTAPLTIAIGDVNEAPAVSLTNTVTALAENADTSSAVKVANIVVTDDALGSNVLSLSGADAALFEIVGGTELFLKAGAALDFETNPALDVTVEVDDAGVIGSPDDTAPLSIAVGDVNEAPAVSLANATTALAENADTSLALKVADIVVTDDALGSNVLSLSGADAALFEIAGTELFLKAGATLDFETNPDLDVTVAVDDAGVVGSPDDTTPLSISVTDANEAPAVSLTNTTTALAENADTSSAVKVADIVVTDDALGSNSLTLSGADAALFEIVGGTELFLKAGAALDFETNPDLDVTVEVDDAGVVGSPDDTAPLSIAIGDVNEAPTVALTNTVTALNEDTDTTLALKVADIVVTDDALGSNVLSLSGADAALFEIVGGTELFLKAGAALDFETNPALDLTVEVDDAGVVGSPDDTAPLTIAIGDVNEAPAVSLTNPTTAMDEDTDTTLALKVADIVVTDDVPGSNVLSLSGTDAALFEIVGTELFLIAGAALDFETNPNLDVTVAVDDAGVGSTPDDTADLLIAIGDVNEAPTDIGLTNATVAEDLAVGSAIGVLSASDPDAGDTASFSIVADADAKFTIVGNELRLDGALDFETDTSHSVTVRVTDGGGLFYDEVFVIAVTGVNEAPTDIGLTNATVAEDLAVGSAIGVFSASDPDAGDTASFSIVADADAKFTIVGNELRLDGALDFETDTSHSVTVRVTDGGGLFYDEVFVIAVTGVNEAPTVNDDTVITNIVDGSTITIPISALIGNDSDVEGDALTGFTIVSATGGTAVVAGGDTVVFTPTSGGFTAGTFSYTVSDGALTSNQALVGCGSGMENLSH